MTGGAGVTGTGAVTRGLGAVTEADTRGDKRLGRGLTGGGRAAVGSVGLRPRAACANPKSGRAQGRPGRLPHPACNRLSQGARRILGVNLCAFVFVSASVAGHGPVSALGAGPVDDDRRRCCTGPRRVDVSRRA